MKNTILKLGIIMLFMIHVFSFTNSVDVFSTTTKGKVYSSGGIVSEVGGSTSITYTFEVNEGSIMALRAYFSWDPSLMVYDKAIGDNVIIYDDKTNGNLSIMLNEGGITKTCSVTIYYKDILKESNESNVPISLTFEPSTVGFVEFGDENSDFALSEIEVPTSTQSSIVQELVVDVQIDPSSVAVEKGSSHQFTSTVSNDDLGVIWSVDGSDSSIDTNGLLYVGENESASMLEVRATSIKDSSKVAKAIVQVLDKEETSGKFQLTAQGFVLDYEELDILDEAKLMEKANAKAIVDDKEVGSIQVNSDDLQQVQMLGEAGGILPVNLSGTYTDTKGTIQTAEEWVYVVVKGKMTLVNEDVQGNTLAISGSGFVLSTSEAASLNKDRAITQGKVEAVVVETKEKVEDIQVSQNIFAMQESGGYVVTFQATTSSTIELSVPVLIQSLDNVVDPSLHLLLDINAFSIDYEHIQNMNSSKAIQLANAKAYAIEYDKSIITQINDITSNIQVDVHTIKEVSNKGGLCDLEFRIMNQKQMEVSKDVSVYIKPQYSTIENASLSLHATGFEISYNDVQNINANQLKQKASLSAMKQLVNTQGYPVSYEDLTSKIEIDQKSLNELQATTETGGVYPLTFILKDQETQVEKTILVVVNGKKPPLAIALPKNDTLFIHANNFEIKLNDAPSLSKEVLVQKSQAKAMLMNTQTPVEIMIDEEQLTKIKQANTTGDYEIKLMASVVLDKKEYTTSLNLKITLLNDTSPLIAANKPYTNMVNTSDYTQKETYQAMILIACWIVFINKRNRVIK